MVGMKSESDELMNQLIRDEGFLSYMIGMWFKQAFHNVVGLLGAIIGFRFN